MATLVMIDGRILDPEDAKVSVFDRGFLYGDAVFETIRTYGGVPFALDRHLERLSERGARLHRAPDSDQRRCAASAEGRGRRGQRRKRSFAS